MGNEIVQANYPELEEIASRFGELNQAASAMQGQLRNAFEPLQGGGWIGHGATAFFNEMNDELFPAIDRMIQALEAGRAVVIELGAKLHQAEQEAAAIYQAGSPEALAALKAGILADMGSIAIPRGPDGKPLIDPKGSIKVDKNGVSGVGVSLFDGSLYSEKFGPAEVKAGSVDSGFRIGRDSKGNLTAGAYATGSLGEASITGTLGNDTLGLTQSRTVTAGGFDAIAGYRNGNLGLEANASLGSATATHGVNVAGVSVKATGTVEAGLGLGLSLGKHNSVTIGPFKVGLDIDW